MKINSEAKLLRVFIGETDKLGSVPLYEQIIIQAKKTGIAGATAYKGIMGYGGNSRIHTSKILAMSEDLPLVIEIVDSSEKINEFIPFVKDLFKQAKCGGLITLEKAEIIQF
ncbi:MAG: DUF190 domain-containing protein [Bacteroidetes bacterium]|nr:DUF190 domain-containing protein [Bacteroidota bacterium]MBU2505155.1 DUF190 domain-containing protein [Bacteroidota bacterium]